VLAEYENKRIPLL